MTRAISRIAGSLGSFPAILVAVGVVTGWLLAGLLFMDGAQRTTFYEMLTLVGTVSTFIMVFVIQNTQNREERAVQTKLDAQAHALRQILDHLDIDHDHPLSRLAGLEEAPEQHIKLEQEQVRQRPQTDGSSTGPHLKSR
jgi:low affinity Fe/Cu permease